MIKTRPFYGYVIVFIAFLITAIAWGMQYSFGIFFKPVLSEFGWSRALTSGAFSLCLILNGILAILNGRICDIFGPRQILTVCGLFLGTGYILMSRIQTIWQLYLFYGLIVAIGLSCAYVPAVSTVARWFVKRRGLMTGIAVSGIGFGILVISPLANWMITSFGWRNSYLLLGIVAMIAIVSGAQFMKRDPEQAGLKPYGVSKINETSNDIPGYSGLSFKKSIGTFQFKLLFIILLFYGFSMSTLRVHIVPHAIDLGISASDASNILSTIGGISIFARIAMGKFSEKIKSVNGILIALSFLSVALLLLLFAGKLWTLQVFAVLDGLAYGGMAALLSLVAVELFGLTALGIITGALVFSSTIGEALGPAVAGAIFDNMGSYQVAFLICFALILVGILMTFFIRPLYSREGAV